MDVLADAEVAAYSRTTGMIVMRNFAKEITLTRWRHWCSRMRMGPGKFIAKTLLQITLEVCRDISSAKTLLVADRNHITSFNIRGNFR